MNIDTRIIDGATAVIRPEGRLTMVSTVGRTVLELTSLDRVLRPAVSVQGAFGGARPGARGAP